MLTIYILTSTFPLFHHKWAIILEQTSISMRLPVICAVSRLIVGFSCKYWASEWLFFPPRGRLARVRGHPTACSHSTSAVCLDVCQLHAVMFGQRFSFLLTDSWQLRHFNLWSVDLWAWRPSLLDFEKFHHATVLKNGGQILQDLLQI